MINLLPQEWQDNERRKLEARMLSGFGLALGVTIMGGIVALLPSSIALRLAAADTVYALSVEAQSPASKFQGDQNTALATLERLAGEAFSAHDRSALVSADEILADIAKRAPEGVILTSLTIGKAQVKVRGTYAARPDFLLFLESLKQSKFFVGISSPLSNLLKETKASFEITLSLHE